jgi:hypothetical protein
VFRSRRRLDDFPKGRSAGATNSGGLGRGYNAPHTFASTHAAMVR